MGIIGDPRFELRNGPHGDYLLPPLVEIPGGQYPMGDDKSDYDFEKPAHRVILAPFHIGQFPVTNAEYKLFIDAGGHLLGRHSFQRSFTTGRRGDLVRSESLLQLAGGGVIHPARR